MCVVQSDPDADLDGMWDYLSGTYDQQREQLHEKLEAEQKGNSQQQKTPKTASTAPKTLQQQKLGGGGAPVVQRRAGGRK